MNFTEEDLRRDPLLGIDWTRDVLHNTKYITHPEVLSARMSACKQFGALVAAYLIRLRFES